jgi:hypothetical protein
VPEAPNASFLVINEVYDSNTNANEWFELYNSSITATVDLTSYVIYNRDGFNSLASLPPSVRVIGPRQYKVVTPRDLGTATLAGSGLTSRDFLALKNTATDTVVDLVNWGSFADPAWPNYYLFQDYFFRTNLPTMPAPDGPNSLSRVPDGVDTDSGTDWRSSGATPGFTNPNVTPTPGGATSTPTAGCEDRYESDDTQATSKPIEQNTEQVHTLCRAGGTIKDRDFMVFSAIGGKQYTMLTKDLTGPVDTIITLYDAQGNELAENDDITPGQGLASRIDYTFASTGLYYLQVRDGRSNGGLGYQYTVALISTGALPATSTPTVTATRDPNATATPGSCRDAYEPDGVPETAQMMLIGTSQRHSICPTTDADWVRFFARAGKVYTIRTGNLGVGTDTFMFVFDSDGRTMISQNDDGGDGVASRIDFYPLRDDWYFVQVKNAGDIGGPEQVYDLRLDVVPGAPVPPGTATSIIAPVVTGTPAGATPTRPVATQPPVSTPTQGAVPPTPTIRPTTPPTTQPTTAPVPAPTDTPAAEEPTEEPTAEPTPVIPDVPRTGAKPEVQQPAKPQAATIVEPNKQVQPVSSGPKYVPLTFRVYYDLNRDSVFNAGEGIRGIKVYFLNKDAGLAPAGDVVTGEGGTGQTSLLRAGYRVYIPYLGINIDLSRFGERPEHTMWLAPVALPERVP